MNMAHRAVSEPSTLLDKVKPKGKTRAGVLVMLLIILISALDQKMIQLHNKTDSDEEDL